MIMLMSLFSKAKFLNSAYKNLYCASLKCSTKPAETKTGAVPPSDNYADLLRKTHRPNKFEQKILVWTGRYKSAEEIPDEVSHETMEKARNRARIKVANYMMAVTVVACIAMVVSGKRAAERGETVSKMNMDWHKEINKETK